MVFRLAISRSFSRAEPRSTRAGAFGNSLDCLFGKSRLPHSTIGAAGLLWPRYFGDRLAAAQSRKDQQRSHQPSRILVARCRVCGSQCHGYLLQDVSQQTRLQSALFFVAAALHFFTIETHLREHHKGLYDKRGRWLLTAAIIVGATVGQVFQLNEAALSIVRSFLVGSIILNILKRELPDETKSYFWSFSGGASLYTSLLLFT